MTYTYEWTSAEESTLRRTDENGNEVWVPVTPGNRDYEEFAASTAVATAYVAPVIADPEPTALELLTARVTAIESNEISDDSVDTALINLIANLTSRIQTLEGGN